MPDFADQVVRDLARTHEARIVEALHRYWPQWCFWVEVADGLRGALLRA